VLAHFGAGDYLLLQNEISAIPQIMRLADQRGLRIVFNPAPMEPAVLGYPLGAAACFVLNEVEGAGLTGRPDPRAMLEEMRRRFPAAMTVVTLGENGAMASSGDAVVAVEAVKVRAVDTTGAGDTFIGYFLAEIARDAPVDAALRTACAAAAICVTRRGAADSIPLRSEVEAAEEGKAEKKR
jgi:ribokinase